MVRQIVEPMGLRALEGDSVRMDGVIIAPEDPYYESDARKDRYTRELTRLEKALEHAVAQRTNGEPVVLMMHYPPFTSDGRPTAYVDLITWYQPTLCIYGHLHKAYEWEVARHGLYEGVRYALVAADYLCMTPRLIWPADGAL